MMTIVWHEPEAMTPARTFEFLFSPDGEMVYFIDHREIFTVVTNYSVYDGRNMHIRTCSDGEFCNTSFHKDELVAWRKGREGSVHSLNMRLEFYDKEHLTLTRAIPFFRGAIYDHFVFNDELFAFQQMDNHTERFAVKICRILSGDSTTVAIPVENIPADLADVYTIDNTVSRSRSDVQLEPIGLNDKGDLFVRSFRGIHHYFNDTGYRHPQIWWFNKRGDTPYDICYHPKLVACSYGTELLVFNVAKQGYRNEVSVQAVIEKIAVSDKHIAVLYSLSHAGLGCRMEIFDHKLRSVNVFDLEHYCNDIKFNPSGSMVGVANARLLTLYDLD